MKSELVIVKGQEFKISVQDTIKEDDIFIEQYKQAADMLNAILSENQDSDKNKNNTIHLWQQTEYENNIIAFCGDRGDGKSSAMLTFINALCCKDDHKEDDEIDLFKNRIDKKTYIAEPIVIDHSLMMYIMCWILYLQKCIKTSMTNTRRIIGKVMNQRH